MMLIPICLCLISLAGGMFLLAKTNKDALNMFYRVVAWFIIVASVLTMGCAAMQSIVKMYGKHFHYQMMMQDEFDKKTHKKHMKHGGMYHHCMDRDCDSDEKIMKNCRYGMPCCENNSPRRYWKKEFNDSCVRKENTEKK